MKSILLSTLLLFSATHISAQKMNIIDYFNAFLSNTQSPNNDLQELEYKLSNNNGKYTLSSELLEDDAPINIEVNANKTYLAFKDSYGWNDYDCKPVFKIFTKADGTQILAVTEDGSNYYSHLSKYRPESSTRKNEALENWKSTPKPIKFWTYKNNTWTEVTNEVMPKFFSFKDMIASTNSDLAGLSIEDFAKRYLWKYTHPIYTLSSDSDNIKVWIEEDRLFTFTNESGAENIGVLAERRRGDSTKDYYSFLMKDTKYNTYTLAWDANKGQFVRK